QEEKLEIARRYLIQRQLTENGLTAEQVTFDDEALAAIIDGYTREAGVRNLEREIGAVLRHAAVRISEGATELQHIGPGELPAILGPRRFEHEVQMRTS